MFRPTALLTLLAVAVAGCSGSATMPSPPTNSNAKVGDAPPGTSADMTKTAKDATGDAPPGGAAAPAKKK